MLELEAVCASIGAEVSAMQALIEELRENLPLLNQVRAETLGRSPKKSRRHCESGKA
jgi:hypothetical protein